MELDNQTTPLRLWGGRFDSGPASELQGLSRTARFEWRLAPHDLAGSRVHAKELRRAGIIDSAELARTLDALDSIEGEIMSGSFQPSAEDEDVHTALERRLLEKLGVLGGKLRAGRSRNDQAANDHRLYLRDAVRVIGGEIGTLIEALVTQAEANANTIAPGFTHLQPAQPISFGHLLAGHAQGLLRDLERLLEWERHNDRSSLGAAALAGSTICLHPELSARELGFSDSFENSIDAVGERDFALEFLFAASMIGIHLSRLGEEVCLWNSKQFGWVQLDDAYSTGSSIMPQKKNPDIAELSRGSAGRFLGNLTSLFTIMKGLPLTYSRDMSYDKHATFDSADLLLEILPAVSGMILTMMILPAATAAHAERGFTLATDLADHLAREGLPFRKAHEIVGNLVKSCEGRGISFSDLSEEELAAVHPSFRSRGKGFLEVRTALAARSAKGCTAPESVLAQIAELRRRRDSLLASGHSGGGS